MTLIISDDISIISGDNGCHAIAENTYRRQELGSILFDTGISHKYKRMYGYNDAYLVKNPVKI